MVSQSTTPCPRQSNRVPVGHVSLSVAPCPVCQTVAQVVTPYFNLLQLKYGVTVSRAVLQCVPMCPSQSQCVPGSHNVSQAVQLSQSQCVPVSHRVSQSVLVCPSQSQCVPSVTICPSQSQYVPISPTVRLCNGAVPRLMCLTNCRLPSHLA